jgi:hypothetical protein
MAGRELDTVGGTRCQEPVGARDANGCGQIVGCRGGREKLRSLLKGEEIVPGLQPSSDGFCLVRIADAKGLVFSVQCLGDD